MSAALENLVADADAAAANFTPPAAVPAIAAQQPGTALAKPSLDTFIDGGGMDVDAYFRLKADGFRIGDEMQGLSDDPLIVDIDMNEVTPIFSFRVEIGGNTRFIKSYDGVTTPEGQNFQAACAAAERQPGAKCSGIYQTVEIPVALTETLADPKKGSSVSFAAGTRVGYTPSVTGFKPFQGFMKKLRATNPDLLTSKIKVVMQHAKRVNTAKNEWGVFEFELAA